MSFESVYIVTDADKCSAGQKHCIVLGTVETVSHDYAFVLLVPGMRTIRATMTPSEYEAVNTVVRRALAESGYPTVGTHPDPDGTLAARGSAGAFGALCNGKGSV